MFVFFCFEDLSHVRGRVEIEKIMKGKKREVNYINKYLDFLSSPVFPKYK